MLVYTRQIETTIDADVLVCGAGSAGVAAAIAAARSGARTIVLEKNGFAGGIISAVQTPCLDGMHDVRSGRVVVAGIALELAQRTGLTIRDATLAEVAFSHETHERGWIGPASLAKNDGLTARSADAVSIPMDIERFKLAADQLLGEAGVEVLYHTAIVDVVREGDRVSAVIAGNKGGLLAVRAPNVVDCTGDADIAAWSGAPTVVSESMQPMALHFRFGNVPTSPELRARCAEALAEAHRNGEIGNYGGPWLRSMGPGEFLVNAIRTIGNGLDPAELTRAERCGREDAWKMFEIWHERVPEFKDAYFITSGPSVGVRESRRVVGAYTLTLEDIQANRRFDDAVTKGAWYLDLHPVDGHTGFHSHRTVDAYDISYRTLLPGNVENVLVAGRCHSATHEALASTRVTATAMGMGHAAGAAAALAGATNRTPHTIDVGALRDLLRQQNAVVD